MSPVSFDILQSTNPRIVSVFSQIPTAPSQVKIQCILSHLNNSQKCGASLICLGVKAEITTPKQCRKKYNRKNITQITRDDDKE